MIDSTYIKAHAVAWRQSGYRQHKRELNSKLHLIVEEYGFPSNGTVADYNQASLFRGGIKSRKEQRAYNRKLERHVIENVFRALKRRRGTATRYAKFTASFVVAIHVGCLFLYLPVNTT